MRAMHSLPPPYLTQFSIQIANILKSWPRGEQKHCRYTISKALHNLPKIRAAYTEDVDRIGRTFTAQIL